VQCTDSISGFPKVGQVVFLGATSSKGVKRGPLGHNLKLTLVILELMMKSKIKIKILGVLMVDF